MHSGFTIKKGGMNFSSGSIFSVLGVLSAVDIPDNYIFSLSLFF